jgi:hypothetical protein
MFRVCLQLGLKWCMNNIFRQIMSWAMLEQCMNNIFRQIMYRRCASFYGVIELAQRPPAIAGLSPVKINN